MWLLGGLSFHKTESAVVVTNVSQGLVHLITDFKILGKTKITDLYPMDFSIDKYVLWLDISMDQILTVNFL